MKWDHLGPDKNKGRWEPSCGQCRYQRRVDVGDAGGDWHKSLENIERVRVVPADVVVGEK